MTGRRCRLFLLALAATPSLACGQSSSLRLGAGTFGLVNDSGSEIIALDDLAAPKSIRLALCGGTTAYPLAFARHQEAPRDASSRDIADNFANLKGDVFRVSSGQPRGDGTCYLAPDSALVTTRLPLVRAGLAECEPGVARRIAAVKHRRIVLCRPMASAGDLRVVAVQFAFVDTNALASIVVATDTQLVFEDFPARYDGPEASTWRVDDGGVFSSRGFAILFLSRARGVYVMGLTWAGAEGEDAFLLVADSANAFRQVQMTYRYWSPE